MAKRNLAAAIEEITAEDTTPPSTTPPAAEDTTPPDTASSEDTPPSDTTSTEDTTPTDTTPTDTPPQAPPPESPAAHAYRRQLEKQEQRHKQELDELNKSWEAKFAELKKGLPKPPAEQPKTRADFDDDDSYIAYLVEEGVKKKLGEHDAKATEEKAKADEAAKAQQAADAELQERRTAWQNVVNETFGKDTTRRDAFLKRVDYCNQRGLGQVLEDSPVAANYLMGSTTGVKVLEKLLSDVDTMKKVFNDRTAVDPFEMRYQLSLVEQEIRAAEAQAQGQPPAQPVTPKPAVSLPHGKPGKQAAGNQTPDIFSDDKAMLAFLRSH